MISFNLIEGTIHEPCVILKKLINVNLIDKDGILLGNLSGIVSHFTGIPVPLAHRD
jgi:hypothetical protein